jgi:hypothetical protein
MNTYDGVIIQWDYSFYPLADLRALMEECKETGTRVAVVMHTYLAVGGAWEHGHGGKHVSEYYDALDGADVIMVHTNYVRKHLQKEWAHKNIVLIPHGCNMPVEFEKQPNARFRVGSFGFMVAHKGYEELVELARVRNDIDVMAYAAVKETWVDSVQQGYKIQNDAQGLTNFYHDGTYHDENAVREKLAQCDLIMLPYAPKVDAGASGAVRIAMTSGVPVVSTNVPFMDDMRDTLILLDDNDPARLSGCVNEFMGSDMRWYIDKIRGYLFTNVWYSTTTKLLAEMFKDDPHKLETIHPHYDDTYDEPSQRKRVDWLRKCTSGRMLEIGCATGYVTEYAGGGVGVDLDEVRLAVARQKRRGCEFVNASALALPFDEMAFETVMLPDILEHMPLKAARNALCGALWVGDRVLVTLPLAGGKWEINAEHQWRVDEDALKVLLDDMPIRDVVVKKDDDFVYVKGVRK